MPEVLEREEGRGSWHAFVGGRRSKTAARWSDSTYVVKFQPTMEPLSEHVFDPAAFLWWPMRHTEELIWRAVRSRLADWLVLSFEQHSAVLVLDFGFAHAFELSPFSISTGVLTDDDGHALPVPVEDADSDTHGSGDVGAKAPLLPGPDLVQSAKARWRERVVARARAVELAMRPLAIDRPTPPVAYDEDEQ